ncbi:hypothetical protein L2E82_01064 [Cichorium intybus]|uniref:Uncharacterized protein n=1 Tax=Cichorium intybus TaxID=13427 RepID=A0ACB9GXK3_CICIN|nr:hypothetical protein L2E82_01064 [Cichorium intybus]
MSYIFTPLFKWVSCFGLEEVCGYVQRFRPVTAPMTHYSSTTKLWIWRRKGKKVILRSSLVDSGFASGDPEKM